MSDKTTTVTAGPAVGAPLGRGVRPLFVKQQQTSATYFLVFVLGWPLREAEAAVARTDQSDLTRWSRLGSLHGREAFAALAAYVDHVQRSPRRQFPLTVYRERPNAKVSGAPATK